MSRHKTIALAKLTYNQRVKAKAGLCIEKWCRNYAKNRRYICCKHIRARERENNPFGYYYDLFRQKAKRRGKEVKITQQEYKEFCLENGIFDKKTFKKVKGMTIDRIDFRKGYELGNLQPLGADANGFKGRLEQIIQEKMAKGNYCEEEYTIF